MIERLGKIALSLSGGGVRAVGYHTGVLAYMQRLGILQDVHLLSTVSGGSLVGLGYCAHRLQGDSFDTFYRGFRQDFETNYHFILKLLEQIAARDPPSPRDHRYLVAAYADLLNNAFRFFQGSRFELFFQHPDALHVKEIIVNSLECYFGDSFRFQHGPLSGPCGSRDVEINEPHARDTLLSDIMAASSDLPGAFAPIVFPDDFHWSDDPAPVPAPDDRPTCLAIRGTIEPQVTAAGGHAGTETLTLIDGGVHDNQGVSAIIDWMASSSRLARASDLFGRMFRWRPLPDDASEREIEKRRREELGSLTSRLQGSITRQGWWQLLTSRLTGDEESGGPVVFAGPPPEEDENQIRLLIASDAPELSGADPIYAVRGEITTRLNITVGTVTWITIVAFVIGLISLLVIIVRLILNPSIIASASLWDLIVYGTPLVVLALFVIAAGYLLFKFFGALRGCRNANGSMWPYVKKLRVRDLRNMGWLRGGSVAAVLTDLMPNRIRFLGYEMLLHDPVINEEAIVINEIDDTLKAVPGGLPPWLVPSQDMKDVATRAADFEVRFWMTRDEFTDLIACGQFTTCYNVLIQMWLRTGLYPRTGAVFDNAEHQQIFDQCQADWNTMLTAPHALVPTFP